MQLDLTRFIPFLLLLDSVVDSLELLILCFLRVVRSLGARALPIVLLAFTVVVEALLPA